MSFSITQLSKAVVAGLAVSITASAASADALQSNFSFRIVDADDAGQEILVERSAVKPGEVIHYDLRHENKTDDAMAGLVIAAPVPDGVTITFDGSTALCLPCSKCRPISIPRRKALSGRRCPPCAWSLTKPALWSSSPCPPTPLPLSGGA